MGRWLLRNVNRKSWVLDRIISFSMTLSDPKPGFKGHCILPIRISQNQCVSGTKLLKNTNRKPYTIYLMLPLSITLSDLWPRFQGHDIFRHWMSQKRHEIESHGYYRTSIGSRMLSIERWYCQWPWRTPNPVFKVTAFLESNISNTVRYSDKVTKDHFQWPWVTFDPDFKVMTFFDTEFPLFGLPFDRFQQLLGAYIRPTIVY